MYERLCKAIAAEALPCALVDLDALERNAARLAALCAGKPLRVATKSIRCPELLRRIGARRLMTYSARETELLAAEGFHDLLLAYPTLLRADLEAVARARAALVVDCVEHVEAAAFARVPLVIDVDLSYLAFGAHLGVRRSPLRTPAEVVALAQEIRRRGLELRGVLGYEAQIAGLADKGPARWLLKRLSVPEVAARRAEIARALAAAGFELALFNGGGTGSLGTSAREPALTELTAGSGYLAGHLFDDYRKLSIEPALYFALQVTRRPAPGLVTCHGGGIVASGAAGPDRLPRPALPPGLSLLPLEGAGEVQSPLRLSGEGRSVPLGAPVFFRPAKSGELAEHFNEYLLVRGDRIEARAKTYRGLGHAFLG